jgi:hypothetical protein
MCFAVIIIHRYGVKFIWRMMHRGFQSISAIFAAGFVFAGCSLSSKAQQDRSSSDTTAPAVVAPAVLPYAPSPQIELAAAADPQSGNTQSAPQPAAAGENPSHGSGQNASVPAITGTVTDVQEEIVPGATVVLEGAVPADHRQIVANDNGWFEFEGLKTGVEYHVIIKAKGFVDWESPAIILSPGQYEILPDIILVLEGEQTSVKVYASPVELATEQVKIEEQQRVFGLIPNFYVVYDSANAAPLTAKLKFKMAMKVSTDPITVAGIFFMAGVNQGVRIPDYRSGTVGYGERVGAVASDGLSDIMIGGAILPSLLHQDPRYYYQGTGTTRSRLLHAISFPFVCKGDNGRLQPNYSTIGGDLASSALENLYYPRADRNGSMVAEETLISTIERVASSVVQEFVLRRFTSGPKAEN